VNNYKAVGRNAPILICQNGTALNRRRGRIPLAKGRAAVRAEPARFSGRGSKLLFEHALVERRWRLARETGLEPATSGVTGRRSNQLSYSPGQKDARIRQSDPIVKG
jgi:hypothetical protein